MLRKLGMAASLLCLLSFVVPMAFINVSAEGMDMATVWSSETDTCIELMEEPSVCSKSLGAFYCGTNLNIIEYIDSEWVHVYVVGSPDGRQGFMRKTNLSINGERDLLPVYPIAAAKMTSDTKSCFVLSEPMESGKILGEYLPGSLFVVIGSMDGWLYVRVGEIDGYILEETTLNTNQKVKEYNEIPAIGIARLLSDKSERIDMYTYPSSASTVAVSDTYQEFTKAGINTVKVLAWLGEWAQIGVNGHVYFMMADDLLYEKGPQ